jgi:hypothetical protein
MFSAHRKRLHDPFAAAAMTLKAPSCLRANAAYHPCADRGFPSGSAAFRHCCGNWVVQEQSGNRGGLFVSRDAALRYVREMRIEIGNARS